MLYLEDYLELIEHLPQELRDRFTDIRERDLQVQNSTEQLKERVKLFFAEAKKQQQQQPPSTATNPQQLSEQQQQQLQRQQDYGKLIDDYQETMRYADDKVQIAGQMHEIMIKLTQRLDTELEKFKLELEADHAGITEELEKRSLELDADSRLDDLMNNHLSTSTSSTSNNNNNLQQIQTHSSATTSKVPSGIKDRRRSEHKHHRHHPYENDQDNGYQGRAKLSNNNEHSARLPSRGPNHHNNSNYHNTNHHQRQINKTLQQNASLCRLHVTSTSPNQHDSTGYSSNSAPASVAGDLSGVETSGHYGNNLSSFGNNPGFKNSSNKNNNINANLPFSQQHSALSAALASTTPQLNSVSALAMMNATSVHNKISNNNGLVNDLIDPSSPLVRQNPIAAAASQAIAATQQLQQGRRTPSLKASFAAISAAGLGPINSLGNKQDAVAGSNRNALAPMTPDQQASFTYNQYGKVNANGNSSPLYISVTKSGRPTKRPRHHASHLFPDESPTSISSDNSVFENSESLSSTDFIETGTTFGSTSPSSLDFATNTAQGGNTTLYHRDEAKYCVCRQISYGLMVGCDNQECEYEWFHYDCVGITQSPKGKWYCPDCTRKMTGNSQHLNPPQTQKKRGRKEKLFNLVNNSIDTAKSKDRPVSEQSKNIV